MEKKKTRLGNEWGKKLGEFETALIDTDIRFDYPVLYIADKHKVSPSLVSKRKKILMQREGLASFEPTQIKNLSYPIRSRIKRELQKGRGYLSVAKEFSIRPGIAYKLMSHIKTGFQKPKSELQREKIREYQKYIDGYRLVDPNWICDRWMRTHVIKESDGKKFWTDTVNMLRRGQKDLKEYVDMIETGLVAYLNGDLKNVGELHRIMLEINHLDNKRQTAREQDKRRSQELKDEVLNRR